MKTSDKRNISIVNANSGPSLVSLSMLRGMLRDRRTAALNPLGKKMVISTTAKNRDLPQVAAHFNSFDFDKMGADQAVAIFNAGGHQVASIIN